ncbi:RUN and FYVE domain-containing protein 2 [Taenia solium]|eukprot:TsM_000685300 transcript=TsM_000685300 gene=TsM_000685300
MLRTNSSDSPPPSTSSSSVGSDTETGVVNVPPTPQRRTRSALGSPESVPSATASLGHLSLDHAPPSDSEVEESETEKLHTCTDGEVATTACEGCQRNRLSATVADLHTVKKAMEEMDTRARAEKALFEEQTASFEQRISQLSQRLDSLLKQYQEYRRSTESEFSRLEQERAIAQMELSEVEEHYRTLLRKRHDAAAEMSAPIDLPSSREDLELYALQMREDLLSTGVACEHLRNRLDTETATNRDRLNEERWKRIQMEELLRSRTRDANERIAELTRNFEASKQTVERATERASAEVKRLQAELAEKDKVLQRACDEVAQLRNRVSHLQTDLENTEKVSLDFVRLSQHLQIQLERQREQTQEVRWQDPEDVIQCSGCERPFEAGMVKQNCRHCGAIFCRACLTKVIPPSGARSRPAHVCDMCHTLLVKDAAPYFSSGTFPHADGESSPPSATPATLRKGR